MSPALQAQIDLLAASDAENPLCLERALGGAAGVQLATLSEALASVDLDLVATLPPALQDILNTALNSTATSQLCLERELGGAAGVQLAILAAIMASGGGGSSTECCIDNPGIAYVQTNGNDATAEIGNPAKPFATMQAAYDHADAPRTFYVGAGTHAGITTTGTVNINILGLGVSVTTITLIKSTTHAAQTTVQDLGVHTFTATTIGHNPTSPAGAGITGNGGSNVYLKNVRAVSVYMKGQQGGDYIDDTDNGGDGGNAGTFHSSGRCFINYIYGEGGHGGSGGPDGGGGGSGGSGAVLNFFNGDYIGYFNIDGGSSGGGSFSVGGGSAGGLYGSFFTVVNASSMQAGIGDINGAGGDVYINHAYIGELNGDSGGGELSITCLLSVINTTGGAPTLTLVELSKVNGVVY